MASITVRPNGHRWIQFTDPHGKRQTFRLGNTTAKAAAEVCRRVELLLAARIAGTALDRDTAEWLGQRDFTFRRRLSDLGLIDRPAEIDGSPRLGDFIDGYLAGRKDLKHSTLTVLKQTRRCLIGYFGADKLVANITSADADDWRVWLATEGNVRDNERDALAENTIRRHSGRARQFFAAAVKRKLIPTNPFSELPTAVRGNRARQQFVGHEQIAAAIEAAPDVEWRTIIALARFGGLRIPSELLSLRWSDVDLPNGRMTIRASKKEHCADSGIRTCPIFPELRPYLETAWDAADEGAEYVIERYRDSNANLRTRFQRIIDRAGLKPWPKLFQNLRASRQTELLDQFPVKAVCSWLGNSQPVALEHYAQVTDDHFQAAIAQPTARQPEAKGEADAKQNAKQQASAMNRMIEQAATQTVGDTEITPVSATSCGLMRSTEMTPRGLEPLLPP